MIKKNTVVELVCDMDCTSTGGPFIPKGTKGIVNCKKHDGTVWVQIEGFGMRHLFLKNVKEFDGFTVISHPL